jgi:hypothetical protein
MRLNDSDDVLFNVLRVSGSVLLRRGRRRRIQKIPTRLDLESEDNDETAESEAYGVTVKEKTMMRYVIQQYV